MSSRHWLLAVAACDLPFAWPAAAAAGDDAVVTIRVEVEAKADCFVVRLFVKNDGDRDVDVVTGAGGVGKTVLPTFILTQGTDAVEITPPAFRRPPSRAMKPVTERLAAGREVLYDAYTMGFPASAAPAGQGFRPAGKATISAQIEFRRGDATSRLQLRSEAVEFPAEALPKPPKCAPRAAPWPCRKGTPASGCRLEGRGSPKEAGMVSCEPPHRTG